ncbi:unnamed protein product [Amoebophrya sp. A25]|nr:unnamed protein product [Amoebophrya sp. A25]|eukprot:GSA25T00023133001.1
MVQERAPNMSQRRVDTPYGTWQRKLISDPECMPVAHDLKNFVDQAETNNLFENRSKNEKAEVIHSMLDRSHRQLMETKAFRDVSEEEENINYDFLEKWVLQKLHAYTFGKSREVRQKDRKVYKHIKCLQFIQLQHLDLPEHLESSLTAWSNGQGTGNVGGGMSTPGGTTPSSPSASVDNSGRPEALLDDAAAAFARIETVNNVVNKLICIDTGCRVIMEVIQKVWQEEQRRRGSVEPPGGGQAFGADDFMPLLIYTILRANPGNLWSNIEYIDAYRTPSRKVGQQNYYYTCYCSAAKFVQDLTPENFHNCKLRHISEAEFRQRYAQLEAHYNDERAKIGAGLPRPPSKDVEPERSSCLNIQVQVDRAYLADIHMRFSELESAADLRVGDLAALFQEYKRMCVICADLQRATAAVTTGIATTPDGVVRLAPPDPMYRPGDER